ncbi:hypothetical protein [Ruegeria lacuscaerulensis]|uniref:hypothetical protein n=1 Tax=Ruegeria lacuscaerulensis TaxID=55218 RepID=UPI00147CC75C|nr:hypothetical protein [Ruegeria lacuscaerulensis]
MTDKPKIFVLVEDDDNDPTRYRNMVAGITHAPQTFEEALDHIGVYLQHIERLEHALGSTTSEYVHTRNTLSEINSKYGDLREKHVEDGLGFTKKLDDMDTKYVTPRKTGATKANATQDARFNTYWIKYVDDWGDGGRGSAQRVQNAIVRNGDVHFKTGDIPQLKTISKAMKEIIRRRDAGELD